MKPVFKLALCALAAAGCAHQPPAELVNARAAYHQASTGVAAEQAPAELHTAHNALQQAEKSYSDNGDNEHTRDLAYVAQRKAQLAEVQGQVQLSQSQLKLLELAQAQQQAADLARLREQSQTQQAALVQSEQAREQAEQRADQASAELARIASVKQDERGTVITLSGEVLFNSGKADLAPGAEQKLDQVARALTRQDRTARIVVEGYTDSQGKDQFNLELSRQRAEAVRSYLSAHGVAADRITARGMGKANPVANNKTAEGRANNRRVEIVVQPSNTRG